MAICLKWLDKWRGGSISVIPVPDPWDMRQTYRSIDEAKQAFDEYARQEPRLITLWDLCRHPTPPPRELDLDEDVFDRDPFEDDVLADTGDAAWCAEDFFDQQVRRLLLSLVGLHRPPGGAPELHTDKAYETVHDLLRYWALDHSTCCDAREVAASHYAHDGRSSW